MIRSMTAFSRVALPAGGKNWVVEIRSLNQRYFELSLRLPASMFQFEPQVRQLVQAAMRRGKVSLNVFEEGHNGEAHEYELDINQVQQYVKSSQKLKRRFRLGGDLHVAEVMNLPGVVKEKVTNGIHAWNWSKLNVFLKKALDRAIAHKKEEGHKLERDVTLRLNQIRKLTETIENLVKGNQKTYFEKLKKRLQEFIGDEKMDQDRLCREVAILAERSDITEEIVRMKSHLDLFRKWLHREGEIGRELDFLCQEMNREANTMASKAQFFEVSKETIAVKSEIEKIREQVQNVE